MTTMVTELYDALRDAGTSDEKARKAAEALANYDDRFNRLERQIDGVKSDLTLLKWMVGAVFAFLIPLSIKQFVH